MNALIFSKSAADTLISYQSGRDQLKPIQLIDGRYLLSDDCLSNSVYSAQIATVSYETMAWEEAKLLIPRLEMPK